MLPKTLHILSLVIAVCAGILSIADTITPIASLNPTLAHSWPVILAAAIVIGKVAAIIKTNLEKLPLWILLAFATLQFSGCANYQKTVASRSVGVRGYVGQQGDAGGKAVYTVTYR